MSAISPKTVQEINSWTPTDVVAIILIIVCAFLIYNGANGTIHAILIAVAASYFSVSHQIRHKH